jgi:hypothetical protein
VLVGSWAQESRSLFDFVLVEVVIWYERILFSFKNRTCAGCAQSLCSVSIKVSSCSSILKGICSNPGSSVCLSINISVFLCEKECGNV